MGRFEFSYGYDSQKVFRICLISSIVIHFCIIIYFSITQPEIFKKQPKQIEITYQVVQKQVSNDSQYTKEPITSPHLKKTLNTKEVELLEKDFDDSSLFSEQLKDVSKLSGKYRVKETEPVKFHATDLDRKVFIPVFSADKINDPADLGYTNQIREAIRERAQRLCAKNGFSIGKVFVTMLLASSGRVMEVKIIEQKTRADDYLRSIAIRSVKESSPFKSFPKNINIPHKTFNMLIEFRK